MWLGEQPWCDFRSLRSPERDLGRNPERMKASEQERDVIRSACFKALCGKRGKRDSQQETVGRGQEAGGERQGKGPGSVLGVGHDSVVGGRVCRAQSRGGGRSVWETRV